MATKKAKGKRAGTASDEVVERLRAAMREAGFDPDGRHQTAVARLAGVNASQLNRFLKGGRMPNLRFIGAVALALNVHPGWLVWGLPPKKAPRQLELADEDLKEIARRGREEAERRRQELRATKKAPTKA